MLVLTRKAEEKIVIGKNKKIVITILKIQGDKVSIGIEADKETPIYRNELLLKEVEKSNKQGAIQKHAISAKDIAHSLQSEMKSAEKEEETSVAVSKEPQ